VKLHDVRRPNPHRRYRFRVGIGESSGLGKTAGRGTKGMWSRSGASQPAWFEGGQMPLVRRVPKRGFSNAPFRKRYATVNVGLIARRFPAGSAVDPATLRARGILRPGPDGVKVLGGGEVPHALTVRAHAFSASARAKIEQAGGSCELLPPPPSKKPPKKPKAAE
jgi:large subunit ribosomal protein L15